MDLAEPVGAQLRLDRRFRGPAGSANGGFAAGTLAALLDGAAEVEVTLRRPPPLDRPLSARRDGGGTLLMEDDGRLLGEAAALPADTAVLLGRMTARLAARPRTGAEHRVVAWLIAGEGRKLIAGSALLAPDGGVLAAARAVWITVPRATLKAGGPE